MSTSATATADKSSLTERAVMTYVVIAALSFLGFGLIAIIHPETILNITATTGSMNAAAKTFANIFAARNLPIGIAPLILIAMKERKALAYSCYLLGAMQALDFVFSISGNSLTTKVLPPILVVLYYLCGRYLLRTA
jgi:hypothetical protein